MRSAAQNRIENSPKTAQKGPKICSGSTGLDRKRHPQALFEKLVVFVGGLGQLCFFLSRLPFVGCRLPSPRLSPSPAWRPHAALQARQAHAGSPGGGPSHYETEERESWMSP